MKKPILFLAIALILATLGALAVWHLDKDNDLSSDEPPFSTIKFPLKELSGDFYLEGQCVRVGVTDSNGASYDIVFPWVGNTTECPKAFYSARNSYGRVPVLFANPSRARSIVLGWLRHVDGRDEGLDRTLEYLSGHGPYFRKSWLDRIRAIFR
jgi:hypothetical protein